MKIVDRARQSIATDAVRIDANRLGRSAIGAWRGFIALAFSLAASLPRHRRCRFFNALLLFAHLVAFAFSDSNFRPNRFSSEKRIHDGSGIVIDRKSVV